MPLPSGAAGQPLPLSHPPRDHTGQVSLVGDPVRVTGTEQQYVFCMRERGWPDIPFGTDGVVGGVLWSPSQVWSGLSRDLSPAGLAVMREASVRVACSCPGLPRGL